MIDAVDLMSSLFNWRRFDVDIVDLEQTQLNTQQIKLVIQLVTLNARTSKEVFICSIS